MQVAFLLLQFYGVLWYSNIWKYNDNCVAKLMPKQTKLPQTSCLCRQLIGFRYFVDVVWLIVTIIWRSVTPYSTSI